MEDAIVPELTKEQLAQVPEMISNAQRIAELERRLDVVIDILGGMRRSFGNVTFVTPDDKVE